MLSRKKFGLGIVGVILIAVIYYFTAGSEKLTNEMKMRVNTELTMIKNNGFAVQERDIKEKTEHFVLSVNDPKKIVNFFKQQGSEMSMEDAKLLVGMKIGVDLQYLNDTYSALSADMYPLNLPTAISNAKDLDNADKALIKQLNDMLKRKALLVHVDFNKLLSSFKGYVKDIHETFTVETIVKVVLEGNTFEGKIKDDSLTNLSQKIKHIAVTSGDELDITLNTLESQYTLDGASMYDSNYKYSIAQVKVGGKKKDNTFSLAMQKIQGNNETSVKNNFANNKTQFQVKEITLLDNKQKTKLLQSNFVFTIENLDMDILKQLEAATTEEETNKLTQMLIAKGIKMEIPNFEVKKMEYLGKTFDGFALSSSLSFNKTANFSAIQTNPLAALSAINTKTKIILSDALFTLISQQPKAMMLAMMIQPKVVNGKKVYELELKDGKLSVNGQSLM